MDLDDSGFLTLRELARGVPTFTQVQAESHFTSMAHKGLSRFVLQNMIILAYIIIANVIIQGVPEKSVF